MTLFLKRRKFYISLISFTALIIIFFAFVVYLVFSDIKEKSQKLQLMKGKSAAIEKSLLKIEGIKSDYDRYNQELAKINDLFVDSVVPIKLITFLEETASTTNVELKIDSITKNSFQDKRIILTVLISAVSSFENFSRFLDLVENGYFLTRVSDLSIRLQKDDNNGNKGVVAVKLSLDIFAK